MPLSAKEIDKLALLSRLSFDDTTRDKFAAEFENILQFVEIIQEADTENVAPLTTTVAAKDVERADVVTESDRHVAYQRSAPRIHDATGAGRQMVEQGFYVVPKIVE